ncbi:transposase [Sedimentibacter acidaminivorans]|uniref:Transposase n=1 Tax=Sedimentibacter acidaminivorans TaxID=913099 RepID=A0ABS4GA73_9FIRM|nr:hypothetical protein [Sedimentibacter acidaminivorans]MBP1924590.1 transposase [Sedimentibacter acidaminivorans]
MKNFDIAFQLGAKMDPSVKKSFGNASKQLSNMQSNIKNTIKAGAKLAVGIAAAATATVGSAVLMANKFAETGDHIDKLSQKLGMSRKSFQEWDFILSQNGTSIDSMGAGMKTLTNQVDDLSKGGKVATDAFSQLGLSYEDMAGLTQEQIFEKTVIALQGVEDTTKRAAIANDLLGKSGAELAPLLNAGADSVEAMKKQAHDLGLVLGDEAVDAAVLWTDTTDQAKRAMGGLFNTIASKALPGLQKFLNYGIEKLPMLNEKISTAMTVAGNVFRWLGENGLKAFNSIKSVIQENQPLIIKIRDTISGLAQKGLDFYNLIKDNWPKIKPVLIGLGGAILIVKSAMLAMSIVQTVTGFMKLFQAANLAAKLSMLGLNGAMLANPMTWVIAGIMALIAAGILLYKNWDTVKEKAGAVWDSIVGVIRGPANTIIGFANGIITAYENMINAVGGAVNKIPSISLPKWLGGGEFGIPKIPTVNLPRIPMLENGGIATGPTLAMIGEGAENEAVLPISKLKSFIGETGESNSIVNNNRNDEQKIQVVYSPQYIIPEGVSKKEIEEISRKGYEEFKRWMKKYESDKVRLSF